MKISKATIRFFAGMNEGRLQQNGGQAVTKESSTDFPSPPRDPGPPRVKVSYQPPTNSHELQPPVLRSELR